MTASRQQSEWRDTPAIPEEIENTAADWVARRDRGFGPAEEAAFQKWTSADPRHAAAVAELEEAWATINQPRLADRGSAVMREIVALETRRLHRRRRRAFAIASAMLAAAAAIMVVFFRESPGSSPSPAALRTVTLRPDRQFLPDGSSIELNAGAEIAVDFSPRRRGVRLVRGEALFSVAKDSARLFVVNAGGVEVRAVGTAFSVHYEPGKVNVLVTEGRVAVLRASDGRSLIGADEPGPTLKVSSIPVEAPVLTAGHRVVIPVTDLSTRSSSIAAVSTGEIADALAWRHRRVEFTSTPLAEAVPLFNRANQLQLILANASTAELRISGVFWTDDPDGFARLLESSLGVKALRGTDNKIVLSK